MKKVYHSVMYHVHNEDYLQWNRQIGYCLSWLYTLTLFVHLSVNGHDYQRGME